MKLHVACGNYIEKGFKGMDFETNPKAEIKHDLNVYPYPLKDESVDRIHCAYFVHRVEDLVKFMDEMYRVLKKGSTISIVAPYYSSIRATQDPTTKRLISEVVFSMFNKKAREAGGFSHYTVKSDFEIASINHSVSEEFKGRSQDAVAYAAAHYHNVIHDVSIVLKK